MRETRPQVWDDRESDNQNVTSLEPVSLRAAFSEPFPGIIKYKFFPSSGNCTTYAAFLCPPTKAGRADDTLVAWNLFSCLLFSLLKVRGRGASFYGKA